LSAIQKILRGVDRETLDAVFQEWMIRLQKCIDGNGEYVEWCLNWNVQFPFLNGRSWDATLRWNTAYLRDYEGRRPWTGPSFFVYHGHMLTNNCKTVELLWIVSWENYCLAWLFIQCKKSHCQIIDEAELARVLEVAKGVEGRRRLLRFAPSLTGSSPPLVPCALSVRLMLSASPLSSLNLICWMKSEGG